MRGLSTADGSAYRKSYHQDLSSAFTPPEGPAIKSHTLAASAQVLRRKQASVLAQARAQAASLPAPSASKFEVRSPKP